MTENVKTKPAERTGIFARAGVTVRDNNGRAFRIFHKKRPLKQDLPFYIMLLPALVLVLVFSYGPMFGLYFAFKADTPGGDIMSAPWADHHGFGNFVEIFSMPDMLDAIWNTFFLNLLGLVISFPAPFIFALLLNEISCKIFKRVNQTISYLPHFLSWLSVTGLTTTLMSSTGVLTEAWIKVFGSDPQFLSKSWHFIPIYILLTVWKNAGWGSIIYLANISGIDAQLYEAAEIDGAGKFKQCWHITIPALLPTVIIMLILQLGQMFNSNFDLVYGLQNLYFTDEVIGTVVYKQGLQQGRYGISTALSLAQGLIALVLTLGANWLSRKLNGMSLF